MIVSKFKTDHDRISFGQELVGLFGLTADEQGCYDTSWGPKTLDGLARSVERMYRERVYGLEEQVPDDERYYAANISGEDPQWPINPTPLDDFPV